MCLVSSLNDCVFKSRSRILLCRRSWISVVYFIEKPSFEKSNEELVDDKTFDRDWVRHPCHGIWHSVLLSHIPSGFLEIRSFGGAEISHV